MVPNQSNLSIKDNSPSIGGIDNDVFEDQYHPKPSVLLDIFNPDTLKKVNDADEVINERDEDDEDEDD